MLLVHPSRLGAQPGTGGAGADPDPPAPGADPAHSPETHPEPVPRDGSARCRLLKQSQGSADPGPYMGKADPGLGGHKLSIYLHKVTQGISARYVASRTGVFILHGINIPLRHLNPCLSHPGMMLCPFVSSEDVDAC